MVSDQAKSAGWGIFLLPFLESQDLFGKYNFSAPFFYSLPAYGIDNQSVTNTRIATFLCVSAPQRTDPYSYTFSYPGYPSMAWQAFPANAAGECRYESRDLSCPDDHGRPAQGHP